MADRCRDLLWLVDRWEDVLSDLSAIHGYRRSEALALSAGQFFPLAERLIHYPGVLREILVAGLRTNELSGPVAQQVHQDQLPAPQVQDPTEEEVQAMRDQHRRRRFPSAKFGEHQHADVATALSGVTHA